MPSDIWTRNLWAWPLASLEIWARALELAREQSQAETAPPQWRSPANLVLELAALRLWEFSAGGSAQAPIVILPPYSLHDARVADLAPGHSLAAALRDSGCGRLCLVEWKSATPATQLLGVDDLLAALNVVMDDIGVPADLIGLCQGGWMSLVYAARFPGKARRVVAAGAPFDLKAAVSALSEPAEAVSETQIRRLVESGGGRIRGAHMEALWPREPDREKRLVDALQIETPLDAPTARDAVAAFDAWYRRVLDLPGPYFHEALVTLFHENRLARGDFPALGKSVDLRSMREPVYLLAGESDAIVPPAQALAAARHVGGPVRTSVAPCGHLALFMGRRTLAQEWRAIAAWLKEGDLSS